MLDLPKRSATDAQSTAQPAVPAPPKRSWAAQHRGRLILTAAVVCVVVAGLGMAWNAFWRPLTLSVADVATDVPVQVFGLGTVEARVTSRIGFKVAGVLTELRADVGDRVGKGAVLARLDDREQTAQLARAKATVQQTEASLQRAKASVDKAQANYANAKSINERRQQLLKGSNTSIESAQTAQAVQDAALGDVNLAKGDVLVATANISDAKAQHELQSTTLNFFTLTAPYDAMVTARLKELGSALGAGEPVFTLIDPKTVWVLAYIDESKAGEIRVGETATIVLRSRPGLRLAGHVARIEPESDRVNEERRIEVAFDVIPENFNLGEQAEVYITTVHLAHPLLVPEAAIVGLAKSQGTVWTIENGRLSQHKVTLGHRLLDGRFEITAGVPDKAAVVTQLVSGMRVGRAVTVAGGKTP